MIDVVLGAVGGVAVGFIVGFLTERIRYGNDISLERRRTVSPILSDVYPTLEKMLADAVYGCQLKQRNDTLALRETIKSLLHDIDEFTAWDDKHRGSGLSLNLSHLDGNLDRSLKSLRVYALNARIQKDTYVISMLEAMSTVTEECLCGIRKF